jgi:hypothetical protein
MSKERRSSRFVQQDYAHEMVHQHVVAKLKVQKQPKLLGKRAFGSSGLPSEALYPHKPCDGLCPTRLRPTPLPPPVRADRHTGCGKKGFVRLRPPSYRQQGTARTIAGPFKKQDTHTASTERRGALFKGKDFRKSQGQRALAPPSCLRGPAIYACRMPC